MVDRFKCFDDFKDFVAGEEYSVAGATDTGVVLRDVGGTEYSPLIFT